MLAGGSSKPFIADTLSTSILILSNCFNDALSKLESRKQEIYEQFNYEQIQASY